VTKAQSRRHFLTTVALAGAAGLITAPRALPAAGARQLCHRDAKIAIYHTCENGGTVAVASMSCAAVR
jgi:hypothetical protein